MKEYIPILKKTRLFENISEEDILSMLDCLKAEKKEYKKDEFIVSAGDTVTKIAVLLKGRLHIIKDNYWGMRSLINVVDAGDMFLESFAAEGGEKIFYDVVCEKDSTALFLDISKMLTVCKGGCSFHSDTVKNLFFAVSEKNRELTSRLNILSGRTTREKLMDFFSKAALKSGKNTFTVPFDRQQMADYLFCERSALSRELCKMRDEGLISFDKNRFTLLSSEH